MAFLDVCAAVIRRDARYLLARRPDGAHLAGKWEFPGGKVHPGETLEACICRELFEELRLSAAEPRVLTAIEHRYPEKDVRLHFLSCSIPPDAEHDCLEKQTAAWFAIDELAALDLAPADRRFVAWLKQHHPVG